MHAPGLRSTAGWGAGWGVVASVLLACQASPSTESSSTTDRESTGDGTGTGTGTDTGADATGSPVRPDLGQGPPPTQTARCADYVACAQALMLDDVEDIEQAYGPDAACWDTYDARAECDAACEQELAALVGSLEAEGQPVPEVCDPPQPVTWSRIADIIDDDCVTGCHEPGGTDASLDLSDQPYFALIQVASDQSQLYLVEPGAHEESYLWHKVSGTQGSVGGMGGRMPKGLEPLPQDDIDAIAIWIDDGASG